MPPAGRGASGACSPRGPSALPLPRWGLFVCGASQEAQLRCAPLLRWGEFDEGAGRLGGSLRFGGAGLGDWGDRADLGGGGYSYSLVTSWRMRSRSPDFVPWAVRRNVEVTPSPSRSPFASIVNEAAEPVAG